MKKALITIIAITVFTFSPQYANAQFFKKLEKALNKVGKAIDKVADAETSANDSITNKASDGTKVVNNLSGFTVEYKGVNWYKNFCGIEFVITNKGSKTTCVYHFENMKTFDADGNQYNSRSFVGNNITSLGNGDFDFEPGVPVKCIYALYDLPEKGTTMSLCQLQTLTHDAKQGYIKHFIEFRNVPIPPRETTVENK